MTTLLPAARARHPVLIVNPASGGGKADRFGLVAECVARGVEPCLFHHGDDLLGVAALPCARR